MSQVSLEGVRQFYVLVPGPAAPAEPGTAVAGTAPAAGGRSEVARVFSSKVDALLSLLGGLAFHQAAVFCNHKPQAEWLAARLTAEGFPAAYLTGDRPQTERAEAMESVRKFKASGGWERGRAAGARAQCVRACYAARMYAMGFSATSLASPYSTV